MTLNITEPTVGASSGSWGQQLNDALTAIVAYVNNVETNAQPADSDLTAIAALATTAYGRSLLTQANAAAAQATLGLGSAATQASSAFDAAGAAAAAQAASQPLDSDLTAIAALTTTTFGRSFLALADAAAARTLLGLGTAATQASTAFAPAGTAGIPSTIVAKTTAYTAAVGDFVEADTSTAGFTVTLPTAPAAGALVAVKKISNDANTITIAPAAGGSIDGDANATTVTQWAGAVFEHKGSNVWRIAASMTTTGPAGPTGPQGVAGPTGSQGPAGTIGTVQNAGADMAQRSKLNFVGATVTDDAANNRTTVTVGGGGVAPFMLKSGNYFSAPEPGPNTLAAWSPGIGYVQWTPIVIPATMTASSLACHVISGTQSTSGTIALGLYSDDGTMRPNALLASASFVASASGFNEVTVSVALTAGIYWTAAVQQGTVAVSLVPQAHTIAIPVPSANLPTGTGKVFGFANNGGTTGALPSTAPAPTYYQTASAPRIYLKVA